MACYAGLDILTFDIEQLRKFFRERVTLQISMVREQKTKLAHWIPVLFRDEALKGGQIFLFCSHYYGLTNNA